MYRRQQRRNATAKFLTARAGRKDVQVGVSSLVFCYFAVLISSLAFFMILPSDPAFRALALLIGVALVLLVAFEVRRVGHPLTPGGVLALGGIFLFSLRPLTIALSGTTTPGALLDTRSFVGDTVDAGVFSLLQVTIFYLCFGIVYFMVVRRPKPAALEMSPLPERAVRATGVLMVVVAVFSTACALVLISSSGGLSNHLSGVSLRSSFLAGRYYLTLAYIPFAVAVALYVLSRRFAGVREWNALAISAAALLVGVAFLTGGRGPLLLGVILPLLIIKQTGPNRFRPQVLAVIGVALIVIAMVMSLFLRESVYSGGEAVRELRDNPVATLSERFMSGAETRPFDSLILLNENEAAGNLPVLLGETYITVPSWFIPGALAPWKDGGANTWFTRTYVPRYYYPDRIETSISAVGEAYANFRWVGVGVLGILVALAAVRFSVHQTDDSLVRVLVSATLTPIFFSFIRGDSYQNLPSAMLVIAFSVCFMAVTGVARQGLRVPARGGTQ